MVPALGCDDFLLDESHKLLALRQGQTQIRDIAKLTEMDPIGEATGVAG
jgi:hypothetical protein